MMRSVAILALFTFVMTGSFFTANGQQMQTLINGGVVHGGFGGPVVKFDNVADDFGVWVGGRGAWMMTLQDGHAISIGGGGYGLVTEHRVPDPDFGEPDEDLFGLVGYGGFIVEYTNRSYKLVHVTANTLIGAGGISVRDKDFDDISSSSDPFFVIEPGISLELNVTHFFRISAGMGYRYTSGIELAGFRDKDFTGPNANINLKFGWFR